MNNNRYCKSRIVTNSNMFNIIMRKPTTKFTPLVSLFYANVLNVTFTMGKLIERSGLTYSFFNLTEISLKFGMWSAIQSSVPSFFHRFALRLREKRGQKIESAPFVKQPKQNKLKVLCFSKQCNDRKEARQKSYF